MGQVMTIYTRSSKEINSETEQLRKPQEKIFQRACDQLGVTAPDIVIVGDHPEADIAGAKSARMKTIWKRNLSWTTTPAADAIIDKLHEISTILEQFNSIFDNAPYVDAGKDVIHYLQHTIPPTWQATLVTKRLCYDRY
jgi:histidinol phosphatase-like enzyme